MSTREDQKNARRQAILNAAQALIMEGKSRDFSMPALAKRAGVSLVTPYNLFGSKSHILLEIVRSDIFARTAEVDSLLIDDLTRWAEEAARVFGRAYFRGRHYYRCLTANLVTQESAEGMREILNMMYHTFEDSAARMLAARKVRQAVSAKALAKQLGRSVIGGVQHCLMERGSEEKYRREIETGLLLILASVAGDQDRSQLLARVAQIT
jgi:AcrR family transcriptional regulator